ncbi:hypothetical protein PYCC9005_002747 [Savitreella phatthalungensis]
MDRPDSVLDYYASYSDKENSTDPLNAPLNGSKGPRNLPKSRSVKTLAGHSSAGLRRSVSVSAELERRSRATHGPPPWLSKFAPDPRLPPDQQLLPTVARELARERWAKEHGTTDGFEELWIMNMELLDESRADEHELKRRSVSDTFPSEPNRPVVNFSRRSRLPSSRSLAEASQSSDTPDTRRSVQHVLGHDSEPDMPQNEPLAREFDAEEAEAHRTMLKNIADQQTESTVRRHSLHKVPSTRKTSSSSPRCCVIM